MNITVTREPSKQGSTIGSLAIDGVRLCYTLEDEVREVPSRPVAEWKVQNTTAIPRGRYAVIINHSGRFDRLMPLLVDVPGFSGVRIHSGNTAADTDGCILLGFLKEGNLLLNSRNAFNEFFAQLSAALAKEEQAFVTVV